MGPGEFGEDDDDMDFVYSDDWQTGTGGRKGPLFCGRIER
jgi:hypothetical protein